jgi:Ca-activated chloride channel family protein
MAAWHRFTAPIRRAIFKIYLFKNLAGMICFEHSGYLWLMSIMLLHAALWVYNRRRHLRTLALLGEPKLVAPLLIRPAPILSAAKGLLFFLAFALLIIALAQPYRVAFGRSIRQLSAADIIFVVDVSKSMYVQDVAPDRLSRARHTLSAIIGRLNGEQGALEVFAGAGYVYVPLTDDYLYLHKAVDSISGSLVAQQGTSLQEALRTCALIFDPGSRRRKVVCLFSDGDFHDPGAFRLADSIRRRGILLFAFGFGTTNGGQVPLSDLPGDAVAEKDSHGRAITSRLQPLSLQRITGRQPGYYFEVSDNAAAASLFLARLKEIEFAGGATTRSSLTALFLAAGLVLLILENMLGWFTGPQKKPRI